MKPIGLYLHVPFCKVKCPYCDFYSLCPNEGQVAAYLQAVAHRLQPIPRTFDTVYFGGGTPNLLGASGLVQLLDSVRDRLTPDCEITTELNPGETEPGFFETLFAGGFRRLSMGLQSAKEEQLCLLGRRHSRDAVTEAVQSAQAAGFTNISLDLMLGLPGAQPQDLLDSAAFCLSLGITHLSCYILKIEEGTPFGTQTLALPEEDVVCDEYLALVDFLAAHGFAQYEISNFCKTGWESRHNLKYWNCQEYLGIGPAAHSFLEGKRFYYPRDLAYFLAEGVPIPDGAGGDFAEYAMLRLRLSAGLLAASCPKDAYEDLMKRAKKIPAHLVQVTPQRIALTPEGFLLSNALIAQLLGI